VRCAQILISEEGSGQFLVNLLAALRQTFAAVSGQDAGE